MSYGARFRSTLRRSWPVLLAYGAFSIWGVGCLVMSLVLTSGGFGVSAGEWGAFAGILAATVIGHVGGNLLGLVGLRLTPVVALFTLLFVGATLSGIALGPVALFLIVALFSALGGYLGIASRLDVIAAWYPLSFCVGGAIVWMNHHGAVSTFHGGSKHALWDGFTMLCLTGGVFLMLVFLTTRNTLGLTVWQDVARPRGRVVDENDVAIARPGRGSFLVLLVFTLAVLGTTALISPYLFRTDKTQGKSGDSGEGKDKHGKEAQSGSSGGQASADGDPGESESSGGGGAGGKGSSSGSSGSSGGASSGSSGGASSGSSGSSGGASSGGASSGSSGSSGGGSSGSSGGASGGTSKSGHGKGGASGSSGTSGGHSGKGGGGGSSGKGGASGGTSSGSGGGGGGGDESGDPLGKPDAEQAGNAAGEALGLGLRLFMWLLALVALLLVLVLLVLPPLRRALLVRHLERPLWPVAPTARVMNLWRRALTLLAMFDVAPDAGETPSAFARRAAGELRSVSECPGLGEAAAIVETIDYAGRGLGAGDEQTMRTAIEAFVRALEPRIHWKRRLAASWGRAPEVES